MRGLLARLGDPHLDTPVVHVAGTNGKGSVTALVASVLQAAGYRTGRFISPYLERFNERIAINGREISDEQLVRLAAQGRAALEDWSPTEPPVEFDFITALGFLHFASEQADIAVIEVGIGGRYDSTNVIETPLACGITRIGLDHQAILGETIPEIAGEKAGIIKRGRPVVYLAEPVEARQVLAAAAAAAGAPSMVVGESIRAQRIAATAGGQEVLVSLPNGTHHLHLPLIGDHQISNLGVAVGIINFLREQGWEISEAALERGVAATRWPGRLEVVAGEPTFLLDGAHNEDGLVALAGALERWFTGRIGPAVVSQMGDKPAAPLAVALRGRVGSVIATAAPIPRARRATELAASLQEAGLEAEAVDDWREALGQAIVLAKPGEMVLATGSLYLVGAVRGWLREQGRFAGRASDAPQNG